MFVLQDVAEDNDDRVSAAVKQADRPVAGIRGTVRLYRSSHLQVNTKFDFDVWFECLRLATTLGTPKM